MNKLEIPESEISGDLIHDVLHEIAEILPSQGPIDVFIHHNTLHGLEHLSFLDALEEGAKIFDAKAFLDESVYIQHYNSGRIAETDLRFVMGRMNVPDNRFQAVRNLLLSTPTAVTLQQVKWMLREETFKLPLDERNIESAKSYLSSISLDEKIKALERINRDAATGVRSLVVSLKNESNPYSLVKEALWIRSLLAFSQKGAPDMGEQMERSYRSNEVVDTFLIRFCEEYLDLGQASVSMPGREHGILNSFFNLIVSAKGTLPDWLRGMHSKLSEYRHFTSEQIILNLLRQNKTSRRDVRSVIIAEAIALKGWAGFISIAEQQPQHLHGLDKTIKPRLIDYIALRLILNKFAGEHLIGSGPNESEYKLKYKALVLDRFYHLAFHTFNAVITSDKVSQALVDDLYLQDQVNLLLAWREPRRQKIWHQAYEENLYNKALSLLQTTKNAEEKPSSRAAVICCLDDREESFRRQIEALDENIKTYATAGFFGVDAMYQPMGGISAPYCPVNIRPTHVVKDKPKKDHHLRLLNLQKRQNLNVKVNHHFTRTQDSILHSWLLTLLGTISLFPMLFSILWPGLRRPFSKFFDLDGTVSKDLSELNIDFTDEGEESNNSGYTDVEMTQRVAAVLQAIGMTKNFSKTIFVFGHGSSSRNNPLRSAYDCGACGGRPGRMNARAFAKMFNKPEVRTMLKDKYAIEIPAEAHCIGGYHNTCNDEVQYYDLDLVPPADHEEVEKLKNLILIACKSNSLERCRRFAQSNVSTPQEAFQEVHERSQTLAEPRPEYGHASNALCIVGKRENTKNLFFDRRAFLVSYDYKSDSSAQILCGIMKAVVPVCGGINLEYFFSALDNEVYGAGSKLPHNIVSMLGLMNGTSSDLRTGLPLQMVEIHEPVRLLIIINCTLEQLKTVIASDPAVKRMVSGQWVRIACWDEAQSNFWDLAPNGEFVERIANSPTPLISNLKEYIGNNKGNLDFARLG